MKWRRSKARVSPSEPESAAQLIDRIWKELQEEHPARTREEVLAGLINWSGGRGRPIERKES